jgi:uncharacterized membrane protein
MVDQRRVFAFDAARGIAMVLVCVEHFFVIFLGGALSDDWYVRLALLVTIMATPTFVLVSGTLIGYQVESRGSQFFVFRIHLIDRAVFLITIGHLLIAMFTATKTGLRHAMVEVYVTDTLAFCIIIGVFLAPALGMHLRLILGLCIYIGSWLTWLFWTPTDPYFELLKNVLVGMASDQLSIFCPLLPWLGVYLAGSSVGGWIAKNMSQAQRPVSQQIRAIGFTMIGAGMVIKALFILRSYLSEIALPLEWYYFASPYQQSPPGPLYLLLYVGGGLLLLSVFFAKKQPSWVIKCATVLTPMGRNSLPIFIAQFFVYYTVFCLIIRAEPQTTLAMVEVFLLLSLMGLWVFAKICDHYRVSRFLTTGLPRFMLMTQRATDVRPKP